MLPQMLLDCPAPPTTHSLFQEVWRWLLLVACEAFWPSWGVCPGFSPRYAPWPISSALDVCCWPCSTSSLDLLGSPDGSWLAVVDWRLAPTWISRRPFQLHMCWGAHCTHGCSVELAVCWWLFFVIDMVPHRWRFCCPGTWCSSPCDLVFCFMGTWAPLWFEWAIWGSRPLFAYRGRVFALAGWYAGVVSHWSVGALAPCPTSAHGHACDCAGWSAARWTAIACHWAFCIHLFLYAWHFEILHWRICPLLAATKGYPCLWARERSTSASNSSPVLGATPWGRLSWLGTHPCVPVFPRPWGGHFVHRHRGMWKTLWPVAWTRSSSSSLHCWCWPRRRDLIRAPVRNMECSASSSTTCWQQDPVAEAFTLWGTPLGPGTPYV